MSYFTTWQQLKLNFEKETGRKKPSDTFLGIFRRSSGLEDATKKLDDAIKKADEAALEKAEKEFIAKKASYINLLKKSIADEKVMEVANEMKKLESGLNAIHQNFIKAKAATHGVSAVRDMQSLYREIDTNYTAMKAKLKELKGFVDGLGAVKTKLEWSAGNKKANDFKLAWDNHKKAFETFYTTAKSAPKLAEKTTKRLRDAETSLNSSGTIDGPKANEKVKLLWKWISEMKEGLNKTTKAIDDAIGKGNKGSKEIAALQDKLAKSLKS